MSRRSAARSDDEPLMARLIDAIRFGRSEQGIAWLMEHGLVPPDDEQIRRVTRGRVGGRKAVIRLFDPLELLVGVAPVVSAAMDGRFELAADSGTWAVIQGCTDTGQPDGELIDLLAWHPRQPDRMRLLTGRASFLGRAAYFSERAPRVHRNAAGWRTDPWGGFVVLDWGVEAMRELQAHHATLQAEDADVAAVLRAGFAKLVPRVVVTGDPARERFAA